MPRDGTDTRSRLIEAADDLFAEHGIFAVATSEIVAAAGQRNASAVTYHFDSRQGLLEALLIDRDAPVDRARGELLRQLDSQPSTESILDALVTPYTECLHSHLGRNYLRIVDQLRADFSEWRSGSSAMQPNLALALGLVVDQMSSQHTEIQQERLLAMMMLMTSSAAIRAQRIEVGETPSLDHPGYVENLTSMLVGVIEAGREAEVPAAT